VELQWKEENGRKALLLALGFLVPGQETDGQVKGARAPFLESEACGAINPQEPTVELLGSQVGVETLGTELCTEERFDAVVSHGALPGLRVRGIALGQAGRAREDLERRSFGQSVFERR